MRLFLFLAAVAALVANPVSASDPWFGTPPGFGGDRRDFVWRQTPGSVGTHDFALIGSTAAASLSDYRGKTVLVNFWATWCPPCVKEMPDLNALQAMRGGEDFSVVAISLDTEGPAVVTGFLDRHGLSHLKPYLGRGRETFDHFRLAELPTTLLIGPDGRIWGALAGAADWDSDAALALIDHARGLAAAR